MINFSIKSYKNNQMKNKLHCLFLFSIQNLNLRIQNHEKNLLTKHLLVRLTIRKLIRKKIKTSLLGHKL